MLKNEFLTALRENLTSLPQEDLERVLDYYSEIIDDCMEDGMTEEEATAEIGSVQEAIANVLSTNPERAVETVKEKTIVSANGASYNGSPFRSIRVNERECDVIMLPSADGMTRVEWSEKLPHTAEVIEGVLTIRREEKRKLGLFMMSFKNEDARLLITIPAGEYSELGISTASGDVKIPGDFSFGTVDVHSASGDIEFRASVSGSMRVKSTSGDVTVEDTDAGSAEIGSVSGDVEAEGINTPGSFSLKTISGDLRVRNSACGEFTAKTVSGDLELDALRCADCTGETVSGDLNAEGLNAQNTLRFVSTSGDIRFGRSDAGSISIRTLSGSVRGSLRTGKMFHCTSRSGSVNVPAPTEGGACEVSTISGSIRLSVES